ncbi:monocarboxylate transporter 12 [Fusarium pseudoanthophilum]|uniref:Monocarboxylate transporter 12 n=1 Tax=Fusarium pseudoanthophilum TaxID=48495 RepID=A0A8H5P3K3_9HYPO|nr:monocarboxylate transporter 12 [Fusarium pseudoanthophilum]
MSIPETLEVPRQLESHELHSWPAPVSQPAVFEPATRTLPQNPEVDREVFADNNPEISQLAPVDEGIAAWRLLGTAFLALLETLILTQGVPYGVGLLILYYPILMMVNEYWIARRGMAYGLLCGASGVSGAVMPFVVQALLSKYGYQTTLRAVAVGLAVLTGPLIPCLDGRLPPSTHVNTPKTSWSFFKSPLFWLYSIFNLFQGFGYFIPSLYLPSFATSLNLGERSGPVLLAVMSVSQVTGHTSTLVAAVTTVTIWGLADSFPVLIGYTILYGFFGAGFTTIWARMSTTITDDATAGPIVFDLLNFGKGVGNVLAGPIGGQLVHNNSARQHSSAAESLIPPSYYWVIIFTGYFSSDIGPGRILELRV